MDTFSSAIEKINTLASANKPFIVIIDFLVKDVLVFSENEWAYEDIYFHSPLMSKMPINKNLKNEITIEFEAPNFANYKKKFDEIKNEILNGNSYLLNFTQEVPIKINASLIDIFCESKSKYKLFFRNQFVCFSPETFVEIADNKISTHPMKGTIDASLPLAEETILNDKKEIAEHNTIVDLLRNDLSIISENVRIEKLKYITKIVSPKKELLQVSSKITGDLPENWRTKLGDMLLKILPAGSISGAPKEKTIDIILKNEGYNRGFYTGVFGIFDGYNFDSAVLIRFIENLKDPFKYVYKAGGGITALSQADKEYKELLDKIYVPTF